MIGIPCCRDLSRLVAADELARASWTKRLCARIHLLLCRPCRAYCDEIRTIGLAARKRYADDDARKNADEVLARLLAAGPHDPHE